MKILLIGANGTIGSAIAQELAQRHEVIAIGRTRGEFQVDISDSASIRKLFERTGKFDALVCAAGSVTFAPLADMTGDSFSLGLQNKLMGQVNLLLIGREYANDGASFTFTTGVLNREPILSGASASLVNGALDAFVKAAAIELPRGLRVTVEKLYPECGSVIELGGQDAKIIIFKTDPETGRDEKDAVDERQVRGWYRRRHRQDQRQATNAPFCAWIRLRTFPRPRKAGRESWQTNFGDNFLRAVPAELRLLNRVTAVVERF